MSQPANGPTSLADLSGFLELMQEQANRTEAKMEALRREAELQRRDADAKLQAERQELQAERRENARLRAELATRPPLLSNVIGEADLAALQSRLQALHEAQLLT